MPFELRGPTAKRVAVIGGGISGMGAAHFLSNDTQVTLFETESRLGGHARTIVAGKHRDQPVDTGFIVFNYRNYPHLAALFEELDVPVTKSDMSFGASINNGAIEYGLNSIDTIFAQRRNFLRPGFVRMIRDILKFNAEAEEAMRPGITVGELCDEIGLGRWFLDYYLRPFSGAIWSTPTGRITDFPAEAMVRFFRNHGLLRWTEQPQWYTVDGGSVEYVKRLKASLEASGVDLRLGRKVKGVRRTPFGAEVRVEGGEWEVFDEVVLATHSDQSLALLEDPTGIERTALSAVRYQPNRAVLHADENVMPKRRKVWSSWSYVDTGKPADAPIDLSYWMNSLQPIPMDDPMFVTLNRDAPIREELIYDETTFHHPVYDAAAIAAQGTVRAINGQNHTWFCGAWMKNGFHEDGLASAVDVVEAMRVDTFAEIAAE